MPELKNKSEIEKMIGFVNSQDLFWIKDLREFMNCKVSESSDRTHQLITNFIAKLKHKKIIQCSEKRGCHRQYIVIKKINITDIYISELVKKWKKDLER